MAVELPKAFFSYARTDEAFALRLAGDLRSAGVNIWIDQLDISPGQHWDRAVQTALETCERLLVILSPASVGSDNVLDEVNYALEKKKQIVPVLYRHCEIPFRLLRFHYIDFTTDYDDGLTRLLKALHIEPPPEPSGPQIGARVSETSSTINGVAFEFVRIPAGGFMMGSTNGFDDERPVHQVRISRAFEMGKYEVTQAQWEAVMGTNPSHLQGANRPVESVSWNGVQEFIGKLKEMDGRYQYRLPTEAEWEYGCRAGSTGDYAGDLDSMAWYAENSGDQTHPVGQKQANAWGLFDMHGNVLEWCQDFYGPYPQGPVTDPQGPTLGSYRVNRGGGWIFLAKRCRSAGRINLSPASRYDYLGFRLVRTAR